MEAAKVHISKFYSNGEAPGGILIDSYPGDGRQLAPELPRMSGEATLTLNDLRLPDVKKAAENAASNKIIPEIRSWAKNAVDANKKIPATTCSIKITDEEIKRLEDIVELHTSRENIDFKFEYSCKSAGR